MTFWLGLFGYLAIGCLMTYAIYKAEFYDSIVLMAHSYKLPLSQNDILWAIALTGVIFWPIFLLLILIDVALS